MERGTRDIDVLGAAAAALGWAGGLLPDVDLLGTRVAMIVSVDRDAHARRVEVGADLPEFDSTVLAVWELPEAVDTFPPSVVSLVGVLVAAGTSWAGALTVASSWAGFTSTAILLPGTQPPTERCLLECSYYGTAVVDADDTPGGARVVQAGRVGRVETARRRPLDRWVEESLYGMLLNAGALRRVGELRSAP